MTEMHLEMKDRSEITMNRALGFDPYVLMVLRPAENPTEEGDLDLHLETGGGVPRDVRELRGALEMAAEALRMAEESGAAAEGGLLPGEDEGGEES